MNYTFFWQGHPADDRRIHGMGFAVWNSMLHCTEEPRGITECIMSLQVKTANSHMLLLSIYKPSLWLPCSPNLCCGSQRPTVCSGKFQYIAVHGVGKMNKNSQRLLELCSDTGLYTSKAHYVTEHLGTNWIYSALPYRSALHEQHMHLS